LGEYDSVSLGDEVYFKKSVDGGNAWQTSKRLTYTSDDNYYPFLSVAIAVRGVNVYLAWHDDGPGNNEIYFRKSADGGAYWQAAQRLTYTAGSSEEPAIFVKNTTVYLAWHDDTAGNDEVYFRKSNDGERPGNR